MKEIYLLFLKRNNLSSFYNFQQISLGLVGVKISNLYTIDKDRNLIRFLTHKRGKGT